MDSFMKMSIHLLKTNFRKVCLLNMANFDNRKSAKSLMRKKISVTKYYYTHFDYTPGYLEKHDSSSKDFRQFWVYGTICLSCFIDFQL